ncbi:CPBP family intramembrane glutamic endopeptidase [Halorussus caseinilyticus]|uniref:CPBP family intramembrane glutamic endopeptidase n=1 Tax=Halorussus caseinilyticus TaxID=3034025 RepID=UPI0023E8F5AA|nr:type II CAAX endopeptidase family protein [Halorussus sp. DT72]
MRRDDILRDVRTKLSKQSVINLLSSPLAFAVVAAGAGEWLLYTDRITYALWGHFLALFACLFAPLLVDDDDPAIRSFVLVPLFRLVNLGMPVFVADTLYWLPLVYGSLYPGIYVLATAEDTPTLGWNVRVAAAFLLPSVFLGGVLGHVEYALLEPTPLVATLTPTNAVAVAVVMVGFVALVEELVFRGLVQPTLVHRIGTWPGLAVTNLLFGAMHSAYASPSTIAFAAGLGLVFSLVYEATESLLVTTAIHGTSNVFLFAIVPLYGPLLPVV